MNAPTTVTATEDERIPLSTPQEREAFLIRCWMSHDAYWFAAVAEACGLAVANRVNQVAGRRLGAAEARRYLGATNHPPVRTVDDVLRLQDELIALLGPDLLEFRIARRDESSYEIEVDRCFAHENVARAGILSHYECGIFPRVLGWLDAAGCGCELTPNGEICQRASEERCRHTIRLVGTP